MSALPGRAQASHLTSPSEADLAWQTCAACADSDPELFYPRTTADHVRDAAFAICYRCEAHVECFVYALRSPDGKHGIWGATTETERELLRGKGKTSTRGAA